MAAFIAAFMKPANHHNQMGELRITKEKTRHHAGIFALHAAAFPTGDEARLVDDLRNEGALKISLVAELNGQVIGHVALSKMQAPRRTLGLAPVATLPAFQNQGIAALLIEAAIAQAKGNHWKAIFVLGDPAYYGRFGFDVDRADGFETPYQGPAFAVLPLSKHWRLTKSRADYAAPFGNL